MNDLEELKNECREVGKLSFLSVLIRWVRDNTVTIDGQLVIKASDIVKFIESNNK